MRIPSGKVDCAVYFVAVDSTDLKTRETGLSSFTVYRSRNGGAAVAYTTPTITEISSANQPGVYSLLVDEDTTIGASSDSEEYCLHITQASMAPVTRVIELYRRDTTSGRTLAVDASSRALSDVDTIKTNPVVNGGTITFPTTATLASTTNITAGTLTTVTTATNLGSNALNSSALATSAVTEIVDGVWNAVLSSYVTAGTAGKVLTDVGGMVTSSGTAQAGAATSITLAASASASNIFDPGYIILTGGTGAGQGRPIVSYNTTTKVCVIQQEWKVTPDNTTTYITITGGERMHTNDGLAQAGSSNTITLNSTAATGTDTLKGQLIWISGGTGADQVGIITAYDGATKIATMGRNWVVTPDNTSVYTLYPIGPAMVLDYENTLLEPLDAAETAAAVWDAPMVNYLDAGSTGEALNAAGAAGDPWTTAIPGAYIAGTAGYIVGNNLDATVSSRASQTSVDTLDDFVDTEVAAIKAKTDNIPADPADASDISTQFSAIAALIAIVDTVVDSIAVDVDNVQTRLPAALVSGRMDSSVGAMAANTLTAAATAADFTTEIQTGLATAADLATVDTVVDAIKAKTDSLTFTVAGVVDANIQRINDVVITGDGQSGTEFGV